MALFLIEIFGFMVVRFSFLVESLQALTLTAVTFGIAQHATESQSMKLGCAEIKMYGWKMLDSGGISGYTMDFWIP